MRLAKKLLAFVLAGTMLFSLMPMASASAGLMNFQPVNRYTPGQFRDVASWHWYASNVKTAYELGIMQGNGDTFNIGGATTVAETLALACRIHNIYYGGDGKFQQGSPWYQVYVDYAAANGIINPARPEFQPKNYACRWVFAEILSKALPNSALYSINDIPTGSLPDVPGTAAYAPAVYLLYNAGILTGSDDKGTFYPDNMILRSEVSAIVTRMVSPGLRKAFTPSVQPPAPTPTPTPTPEPADKIPAAYQAKIQEYLQALTISDEKYEALRESFTINTYIIDFVRPDNTYICYALYDLDGNGVNELFFGVPADDAEDASIYEVYTYDGKNAVFLLDNRYRSWANLLSDGRLIKDNSLSAWISICDVYRLDAATHSLYATDESFYTDPRGDFAGEVPYTLVPSSQYVPRLDALKEHDIAHTLNWIIIQ